MSRRRRKDQGLERLELEAWAKVNLWLHILGRRADDFHTLDSLVVFAGIGDRLSLERDEGLTLEVCGPFAASVPTDEGNLVLRAARALQTVRPECLGARIVLEKRLPVAAGLGGGSSDAAAVLLGLDRLWGLEVSQDALQALARPLGSDLAVCLLGRPALVTGVGEGLERAPPLPAAWMVLVNPGLPLATPAVYGGRSGDFSRPVPPLGALADLDALVAALETTRNDLEPPALALCPVIDEVLSALAATPGCRLARMSGSGATCFGLYRSEAQAESAVAEIQAVHPRWWCASGPMLHGPLQAPPECRAP